MSGPTPEWECVAWETQRLPVPGGWLYARLHRNEQVGAMVFVPHPPLPAGLPQIPTYWGPFQPATSQTGGER